MSADELRDELDYLFDEMSDDDIITMCNAVADDYSDESKIHYMDQFDEIIMNWYNYAPSDLINHLDPNFSLDDEYFTVDDHQNIYSFTDLLDIHSPWDKDACINYIIETGESFDNPDVQLLLDRYDEVVE